MQCRGKSKSSSSLSHSIEVLLRCKKSLLCDFSDVSANWGWLHYLLRNCLNERNINIASACIDGHALVVQVMLVTASWGYLRCLLRNCLNERNLNATSACIESYPKVVQKIFVNEQSKQKSLRGAKPVVHSTQKNILSTNDFSRSQLKKCSLKLI